MDQGDLTDRVRAFVARETGVRPARVTPDTSLVCDLGLAGDDAVDFFAAFANEFGVDPESLAALDYGREFGGEGVPVAAGCAVVVTVAVLAVAGVPVWGFLVAGAGAVGTWVAVARWRCAARGTVRVADLVAAAEAGRWTRTA
jgi:acyl carrier protein